MSAERNWQSTGAGNGAVTIEQPEGEPTDGDVILAMNTYGGNCIQKLGQLFLASDEVRRAKLKACFPDDWAHYVKFAKLKQKGFPS